jgi:hypothetical protein
LIGAGLAYAPSNTDRGFAISGASQELARWLALRFDAGPAPRM